MRSAILLNLVGSVVSTTTPAVQVVQQTQKNYEYTDMIPAGIFKNHYAENLAGFSAFVNDANNCFKEFNISVADAKDYFENNQPEAIQLLHQANIELGKRSFWSWIAGAAKAVAGAVASTVTFGQVSATRELYQSGAEQMHRNEEDVLHVVGGALQVVGNVLEAAHGDGEAASGAVDAFSDVIDHL